MQDGEKRTAGPSFIVISLNHCWRPGVPYEAKRHCPMFELIQVAVMLFRVEMLELMNWHGHPCFQRNNLASYTPLKKVSWISFSFLFEFIVSGGCVAFYAFRGATAMDT